MYSVSVHHQSLIGLRKTNQDSKKVKINLQSDGTPKDSNYPPCDVYIVCDGHGDNAEIVSQYVVDKIPEMLKSVSFPLSNDEVNTLFDRIQSSLVKKKMVDTCGTTCLILIRYLNSKGKVYFQLINIGDCRAVLSRGGMAIPLTLDHKPEWPDEMKRIKKLNKMTGHKNEVYFDYNEIDQEGVYRIGNMSVSRSFGDLDEAPYVTHHPDIFNYPQESSDEFIILACDGLWDVFENHEAVNFIKCKQLEGIRDVNMANLLARRAIELDSRDNITVIIIFLK